jgi:DNA-binding NtrC family response regulator
MRVLIVTPNVTLRDSLQMVVSGLTEAGVISARDCAAASKHAAAQAPDLVLIDGRLPLAEVRGLLADLRAVAPEATAAVLLDAFSDAGREELATTHAEILNIYSQPAGDFFDTLAQLLDRLAQHRAASGASPSWPQPGN